MSATATKAALLAPATVGPLRAASGNLGPTLELHRGERLRIAFTPELPGLYMYHCHNLGHEDGGMMRNCRFEART